MGKNSKESKAILVGGAGGGNTPGIVRAKSSNTRCDPYKKEGEKKGPCTHHLGCVHSIPLSSPCGELMRWSTQCGPLASGGICSSGKEEDSAVRPAAPGGILRCMPPARTGGKKEEKKRGCNNGGCKRRSAVKRRGFFSPSIHMGRSMYGPTPHHHNSQPTIPEGIARGVLKGVTQPEQEHNKSKHKNTTRDTLHIQGLGMAKAEVQALNELLQKDGVPAALVENQFVCKLCTTFCGIGQKSTEPNYFKKHKAHKSFYKDYRKRYKLYS